MSPAKKKKKAVKGSSRQHHHKPAPRKGPVPVPAPQPVPAPVLTKQERRFWKVIQTKNLIGGTMFLMGVAFALGYIASDKAHLHEKIALYAAGVFMLFGAHFMSSEPTERAIKAIGSAIPFGRKQDPTPPPAGEQ